MNRTVRSIVIIAASCLAANLAHGKTATAVYDPVFGGFTYHSASNLISPGTLFEVVEANLTFRQRAFAALLDDVRGESPLRRCGTGPVLSFHFEQNQEEVV